MLEPFHESPMRALLLLFALLPSLVAQPLVLLPRQEQVPCRQTLQFRVPGHRPDELVWEVDHGRISDTGLFTAPAEHGPCRISVHERQDLNVAASWVVRAVAISLLAPTELFLRPREEGRIQVELAFRGGELDRTLIWAFGRQWPDTEGEDAPPPKAHDGRVDATGWVRAPSTEGTYPVVIRLAADPRIHTSTVIRVYRTRTGRLNPQGEPVVVRVQPDKAECRAGEYQAFSGTVLGADMDQVIWSLADGPKEAEIDPQGVFRPTRPGAYKVRATSLLYPEVWGEAEVKVLPTLDAVKEEEAAKANRLGLAIVPGPAQSYLLLGGWDGEQASGKIQCLTTSTGTLESCGELQVPRTRALAVLLTDGTVLVVGGLGGKGTTPVREAERFDHERRVAWRVGVPRWFHIGGILQPLPEGRALLVGGREPQGQPCGAELFDASSGRFQSLDERPWPAHAASARLKDGRVLILGGELNGKPLATVWCFDPGKQSFTPMGRLAQPRSRFTATLLWDEKSVVAIGGRGVQGTLSTAERINLGSGHSTSAGKMPSPREGHAAVLIPTGQILVLGGGMGARSSKLMEDWNPDTQTFQTRSEMESGVGLPFLCLNLDGGVFVHGHPMDKLTAAPLPALWHLWD